MAPYKNGMTLFSSDIMTPHNRLGHLETDKSQSTSGTACSIPAIGTGNLSVNYVATISMTAVPATDQKRMFWHGERRQMSPRQH
jgi:hypothetical protein